MRRYVAQVVASDLDVMVDHTTRLLSVLQKNEKRGAIYQKNIGRGFRMTIICMCGSLTLMD